MTDSSWTAPHRPGPSDSHGDVTVLSLSGELDLLGTADLREQVMRRLADEPPVLVIDLTDVTFLGSSALSILVDANNTATRTSLRVVATGRATRRPLQITALDQVLAVYVSLAEALADLG